MILYVFINRFSRSSLFYVCYLQCTCIVILQSLEKKDTDRLTLKQPMKARGNQL